MVEAALEQNNPPIIIKTDEDEGEIDPNVVRYNTSTYHQCMILIERRVKVMLRDNKPQVAQLVRLKCKYHNHYRHYYHIHLHHHHLYHHH